MIPSQPKPPTGSAVTSPSGAAETDAKAERLSSALRDNLKRRKAQQRARQGEADPAPEARLAGGGDAEQG